MQLEVSGLGQSLQGGILAYFLSWLGFGTFIGGWISHKRAVAGTIALVVAIIGTIVTLNEGLWWVVIAVSFLVVISRGPWRRRFFTTVKVVYRLLFRGESYYESHLKDIIRLLAKDHKRTYKSWDTVVDTIEPNGADRLEREFKIQAASDTVSWIDMKTGTTVSDPEEQGVYFDENPGLVDSQGRALKYSAYEVTPSLKRMLVFLNEPVVVDGPTETVHYCERVSGAWKPLIQNLEDVSGYMAEKDFEEIKLTFKLQQPTPLRIDEITVNPNDGTTHIPADHLSATWSAQGVKEGKYYEIRLRCRRI